MSKKNVSNKTRLAISQARHHQLFCSNERTYAYHQNPKVAKRAGIKAMYHAEVVRKQERANRVLTKTERNKIYSAIVKEKKNAVVK